MGLPNSSNINKDFLESGKKGSLTSNSSSYSFLELPWSYNEAQMVENAEYIEKCHGLSDVQESLSEGRKKNQMHGESVGLHEDQDPYGGKSCTDPLFYPYDFIIPLRIKRFVKNAPFRFSLRESCFLEILEKGNVRMKFEVADFKDLENDFCAKTEIVLIFNRRLFRQRLVAEENMSYKNAITQQTRYERGKNVFKDISTRSIEYQVKYKTNFISIDSREDLLREIKCIVKSISDQKEYIPKVKTFVDDPGVFASYIISTIPGISKAVASALLERFESLYLVARFLKNCSQQDLECMEVWNDDRTQKRKLGNKQACIIKKFLVG